MAVLTRKGLRAAGLLGTLVVMWVVWQTVSYRRDSRHHFVDGLSPDDIARLEAAIIAQEQRLDSLSDQVIAFSAAAAPTAASEGRPRSDHQPAGGRNSAATPAPPPVVRKSRLQRPTKALDPPPFLVAKPRVAGGDLASCPRRTWGKPLAAGRFPVEHVVDIPPQALEMCRALFWNALNTCTRILPRSHPEAVHGKTFVITGDIDDMWIRDSAAQLHPYIPMTRHNKSLAAIVEGLIDRQAFYIDFDPYANAYRIDTKYQFSDVQKQQGRHGYISTWDYELDSGCYYLRLLYTYWKANPEAASKHLRKSNIQRAAQVLVDVWRAEQRHEEDIPAQGRPLYRRPRVEGAKGKPWTGSTGMPRDGKGSPVSFTGMTWSGFRPSDDYQTFGYLVPSNMFAVVALGYLQEMALEIWGDETLRQQAARLAAEIDVGIKKHAIVQHPTFGSIYAYEVDGLGGHLLMDDANVPSLLSVPYLGYKYDPEVYANTRRFLLSPSNPTYASSRNGAVKGIGSPHTAQNIKNNIWHMSLIMQGLTTEDLTEKLAVLNMITSTTGGTLQMHESFDPDRPAKFTRKWFSWANSLFAEFVTTLTDQCPCTTSS